MPQSIAVIGAGVAGCALVAQLRRLGVQASISLWETGRGPGGRASTRRSRADALWQLDHGAPLLNLTAQPVPELVKPLLEGGWLGPWKGDLALLEGECRLELGKPDALARGQLLAGQGGMDQLCQGLLQLAQAAGSGSGAPAIDPHYGTLVRHLAKATNGPWQLRDAGGELLGQADWLVLSSTLLAHPRSQLLFGWPEVPLKAAARSLADLQLDHVLTTLAGIRVEARTNGLFVLPAPWAEPWLGLPFRLLNFDAAAQQRWGLARIVIQPLADGRCAVVAHSSHAFAADHLDVYGAHSAVAKQLQLPPDGGREDQVIAALVTAVAQALAPWLGDPTLWHARLSSLNRHERQLMRWAAAFPMAPGLPTELTLCPASQVAFCGDYVAGVGFGRIEGALRSAEALAVQLAAALKAGAAGASWFGA